MNPTLRGLLIVVAVAAVVTAFSLEPGLRLVLLLLNILFFVAIAYALYRLWRNNRQEISLWPVRERAVFLGAIALAAVDLLAAFALPGFPDSGLESLVFIAVLAACVYAIWRTWRERHRYS